MCISVTEMPEMPRLLPLTRRPRGLKVLLTQSHNLSRRSGRAGVHLTLVVLMACALFQSGCAVGPKYVRPPVETPSTYKELAQGAGQSEGNWKTAQPSDAVVRGKWWEAFHDPQLNELEERASLSNQNIAAAAASFLAARSLVRQARAQYFPTVTTNPSIMNTRPSPAQFGGLQTGSSSALTVKSFTDYSLPFDASWEADLWGRIRGNVRANVYAAQASAADLENVRLSEQAELAADYY